MDVLALSTALTAYSTYSNGRVRIYSAD